MAWAEWRDPAFLDSCRLEGDPAADRLVETLFALGTVATSRQLIRDIVRGGHAPEGHIREAWLDFVATEQLEPVDRALLLRAERVFNEWGGQITLSMLCGSLAGGYAASRVSHLLLGVSRLESSPARRVFETAQLLFHVASVGGMETGGRGVECAERVRLMHAGIRRLVRHYQDEQPGEDLLSPTRDLVWRRSWGEPINQEDMMGTIMTMALHSLHCAEKLGARISAKDRWAWVYTWLRVGRVCGVKEALLPTSLAEAEELWAITQRRQFQAGPANALLANALLDAMSKLIPGGRFGFIPRGLVWQLNGREIGRMVGIKPLGMHEDVVFRIWLGAARVVGELESRSRFFRQRIGSAGTVMARRLDGMELGGERPNFAIPESLSGEWAMRPIRRRS